MFTEIPHKRIRSPGFIYLFINSFFVFWWVGIGCSNDPQTPLLAKVAPDWLDRCVFIAVQWCVFVGSQCVVAGTTKLPYGQIPLMLYNGVFL